MSESIEFCDCGEAVTVYDKGDGITRHSRCDKPHYASYLATQLEESRKQLQELRTLARNYYYKGSLIDGGALNRALDALDQEEGK